MIQIESEKPLPVAFAAPLVSCLCITQPGRERFLAEAVACFEAQDYPNKELVIVNDTKDGRALGELRNESMDRASGHYLAHWDDDDLSHPSRLSKQISEMIVGQAQASFLERVTFRCLCGYEHPSHYRNSPWENTMIVKQEVIGDLRFPLLDRGEDTVFVNGIMKKITTHALIREPGLYTYRYHGQNTWDASHWDEMFVAAYSPHTPSLCLAAKKRMSP